LFKFYWIHNSITGDIKLKTVILAACLFFVNTLALSQPNFSVQTVDGFDNFRLGVNFAEPFIVTNPNNPLNSVSIFYTLHTSTQAYYTLDGHEWRSSPLSFGYFGAGPDPFIATDKFGNFYITVLTGFPSFNGISLAKSTNGGVNWSYHRVADGFLDKECIVGDITNGPYGGNLYVAWQGEVVNDTTGLAFSRSTSGGVNWSHPAVIYDGFESYCPYLAIGPNGGIDGGSVYYGYNSFDTTGNLFVEVKRSTDGGLSFSNEVLAASNIRNPQPIKGFIHATSCIQMAADNSNTSTRGYVYIVYATDPAGNDKCDVYFTRSTNLGAAWDTPKKINDDTNFSDQWMPAIACDKETGKIFVSWFDSRFDPANLQVKLYGSVSTDGGVTFAPNSAISNQPFLLGGINFWGHYMGVSAIKNTSYAVWTDNRENNYGSYAAFYPDYAFITSPGYKITGGNDSFNVTLKIPARNGPFNQSVKFTPLLETLPLQGNISVSFLNNRDSIATIPDSVIVKIKTTGNVTPGRYRMTFTSRAADGLPIHKRYVDILVGYSYLSVGTNRNGLLNFKVNGISHTNKQELYLPNNSVVSVQALSPQIITLKKYVFQNWSDGGDTTHNVTLNNSYINLTANYKVQVRLVMDTTLGNTFGGNAYYDSSQTINFGVLSRNIIHNGQFYRFAGWSGSGSGSYSSPDSTGNDTSITMQIHSSISENPRWLSLIGIEPVGTEIPAKFNLYTNYPNPFNPVTKIKFDIARLSDTKLIIYDILGRVIEMSVNEQLRPGRYEIAFDGSRLASGVYFYKLETNDFVDTKKMLLVK
jgi:hypothetical protein